MGKDLEPRRLSEEETRIALEGANAGQGSDLNDPKVQEALRNLMKLFEGNKGYPIIILQTGIDGTPPEATIQPSKFPTQK